MGATLNHDDDYRIKVAGAVIDAVAKVGGVSGHHACIVPHVAVQALIEVIGNIMAMDPSVPTHAIDQAGEDCGSAIAVVAHQVRRSAN